MLSLFVLAPISVVLTAVLVFAAIGRRDRLDQGNRTQRPRGPKKPRYRQEGAKEGPREAEGKAQGDHGERRQGGAKEGTAQERPREEMGTGRKGPVITSGCLICAALIVLFNCSHCLFCCCIKFGAAVLILAASGHRAQKQRAQGRWAPEPRMGALT